MKRTTDATGVTTCSIFGDTCAPIPSPTTPPSPPTLPPPPPDLAPPHRLNRNILCLTLIIPMIRVARASCIWVVVYRRRAFMQFNIQ